MPQLAARSRLGQALLEQEYAMQQYQVAVTLFNQWLGADTLYDVQGGLPSGPDLPTASLLEANPHLQVIQAQRELAAAAVETEKAQLLPQINSGLKLQSAFGTFPLFGYQAGVNVPIFKKAYHGRIEAAEVGVKVQEAALKTERQQLERTISELRYRLEHQLHILKYLQQDLTPIVNEQSGANLQAYQEGEIGYLEFLDGLEQVVKVKQQYLTALLQFNALQVEMDYWTGR
jgi:cobalt-zinc-cadmium resistance protein CzcA